MCLHCDIRAASVRMIDALGNVPSEVAVNGTIDALAAICACLVVEDGEDKAKLIDYIRDNIEKRVDECIASNSCGDSSETTRN